VAILEGRRKRRFTGEVVKLVRLIRHSVKNTLKSPYCGLLVRAVAIRKNKNTFGNRYPTNVNGIFQHGKRYIISYLLLKVKQQCMTKTTRDYCTIEPTPDTYFARSRSLSFKAEPLM
jgi:hypothetical protein